MDNTLFGFMKIVLLIIITFLLLPTILSATTIVRSGCCSHHGGVCGCRCCDGTSLSATCLPYYPQCSSPKLPTIKPEPKPEVPKPETIETPLHSESKPESIIDSSLKTDFQPTYTASIQDTTSKSYNWIYWLIGITIFGGIIWAFKRKK